MIASLVRDFLTTKVGARVGADDISVGNDGVVELRDVELNVGRRGALLGFGFRVVTARAGRVRVSTFSKETFVEDVVAVVALVDGASAKAHRKNALRWTTDTLRAAARIPLLVSGPLALGLTGRDWRLRVAGAVVRLECPRTQTSFGAAFEEIDVQPARRDARGWRREAGCAGVRAWACAKDAAYPAAEDEASLLLLRARSRAAHGGSKRAISIVLRATRSPSIFVSEEAKADVWCGSTMCTVVGERKGRELIFRAFACWSPGLDVRVSARIVSALGDESSLSTVFVTAAKISRALDSNGSYDDGIIAIKDAEPGARDRLAESLAFSVSEVRGTVAIRLDGLDAAADFELDLVPPFVLAPSEKKLAALAAFLVSWDRTLAEGSRGSDDDNESAWNRLRRGLSLQSALSKGDNSIVPTARRIVRGQPQTTTQQQESIPPLPVTVVALVVDSAKMPSSRRLAVRVTILKTTPSNTRLTRHASVEDCYYDLDGGDEFTSSPKACSRRESPDDDDATSTRLQARVLAEDYDGENASTPSMIVAPVLDTFILPPSPARISIVDLDAYQVLLGGSGPLELAHAEVDLAEFFGRVVTVKLSPTQHYYVSELFPRQEEEYAIKLAVDALPLVERDRACGGRRQHSHRDHVTLEDEEQTQTVEASLKASLASVLLPRDRRRLEATEVTLKIKEASYEDGTVELVVPVLSAPPRTLYQNITAALNLASFEFKANLGLRSSKSDENDVPETDLADALAAAAPPPLLRAIAIVGRRCLQHIFKRPANRLGDFGALEHISKVRDYYDDTVPTPPPLLPRARPRRPRRTMP